MSYAEALARARTKRPTIAPNESFDKDLKVIKTAGPTCRRTHCVYRSKGDILDLRALQLIKCAPRSWDASAQSSPVSLSFLDRGLRQHDKRKEHESCEAASVCVHICC